MTFFEGRLVVWSDHPGFLLPAEQQLSSGTLKKRHLEAFKQRQAAPDPEIHAHNVETSISELLKIRDLLDKSD